MIAVYIHTIFNMRLLFLLLWLFTPCILAAILTSNINRNALDMTHMATLCGKREMTTTDLIFGGNETDVYEWPWLVALYGIATNGLKFRCGGSLISNNLVITAAHCCKHIQPGSLVVYLRKYSQSEWGDYDESVSKTVVNCTIHPNYKERLKSDSDIGILLLESPVTFSTGLQPICLPEETEKQTEANINGIVVGWGMTNESKVSEFPMKAEMPVVSYDTCLNSHSNFQDKLTKNIFCAGKRDGTGPCVGDSGGGFYVRYTTDDGQERWKLQGVVSRALRDQKNVCLFDEFFMFTDVTKFIPWINDVAKYHVPKSFEMVTTVEEEEAALLLQNQKCTAQLPKLLKTHKNQVFELTELNEALTEERRQLKRDFERAHKFELQLKEINEAGIKAMKNGDYVTALHSMFAVLEMRRRISGENHVHTVNTKAAVATLLSQQERHGEAEKLYLDLAQVPSSALEEAHVHRSQVLLQLARQQIQTGKLEEALATYDQAILEMLQKETINNYDLLLAKREKANLLSSRLSRYEEALETYHDIFNSTLQADADVIDKVVTSREFARALNLMNKHEEALEVLKTVMVHREEIKSDSEDLALILFELACTYEYLGQLEQAIAVYN